MDSWIKISSAAPPMRRLEKERVNVDSPWYTISPLLSTMVGLFHLGVWLDFLSYYLVSFGK
jgi:hypothetical protein